MAKFQKGRSGNPAGRPAGTSKPDTLRQSLGAHVPAVIDAVVQKAKKGDMAAAKLILDRTVPAVKPRELRIAIELPEAGSLVERGDAVINAIASGTLLPGQGKDLLAALTAQARLIESTELLDRIAAIEAAQKAKK
ncbi:hypothetical protein MTYM_00049 [Methylococcales bacterium]|nr:hypothetical protein MTYM_00049 [Methylococcales bacterium]